MPSVSPESPVYIKPPLGLVPRFVIVQSRTMDILDAMRRYVAAGMAIPEEWRKELNTCLDDTKIWRKPE